jgi:predicted peptidase
MRKWILMLMMWIFACAMSFGQMKDMQTGAGTKAKIYLPVNYDSVAQLPLMIFLHGIGERGTDLNLVLKHGTPYWIAHGKQFPFIVVAPQLGTGANYTNAWIDEVLEYTAKNYKVDRTQIWLVGFSFGGLGTWNYVQNPVGIKKLAAFVTIAGGSNDPAKASVIVNEGISGWSFHSTNDATVAYAVTTRMVTAVNQLAKREQIKLTTYASGHIIASKACDPVTNPALYEWLSWQRRPGSEEAVISTKVVDGNVLKIKTLTKEYSISLQR